MDSILRGVTNCFKDEIRAGVDIAARIHEDEFLIAMPGSPRNKAEEIALQIKNTISQRVQAPQGVTVELSTGVAEFSNKTKLSATSILDVDNLISVAKKNSRA